ncbi:MAG: hypothetical protein NTV62_02550 [Candidatus Gribaldobacteria bacterium]|nr:hypothetical protein [Candidatus Gribaldobacteria bacterium]
MRFFKFKTLFLVVFILVPNLVFGANVYLIPNFESVAVGDTVMVNVEMDTDGQRPNTIEGDVLIDDVARSIKILDFSKVNSVLTYWLQNPFLDGASKISFTAGTPGGFSQKSGLLFKIVFLAEKEGQIKFSPDNFKVYNNDGKATLIKVVGKSLVVTINPKNNLPSKDQWLEVVSGDKQPPQNLTATVGQDNSVFEGKKFINISSVDSQSGVAYYEIKEGDWPITRSGETYVLLDQSESSAITITAYDKAGNHSQILFREVKPKISYGGLLVILIVLLVALYVSFRIFKLIKKKNA